MNFFHKLFNPHCQHCIDERRESKVCSSCEILQLQVARLQYENEKLLSKLLDKPEETKPIESAEFKPITPKLPWNARRQLLEKEDRHKAKLMKAHEGEITVSELEAEMDIVKQEREGA